MYCRGFKVMNMIRTVWSERDVSSQGGFHNLFATKGKNFDAYVAIAQEWTDGKGPQIIPSSASVLPLLFDILPYWSNLDYI